MKTSKITTYWTGSEAVTICEFLDEIRNAILTSHATEIAQFWEEVHEEQMRQEPECQKQIESGEWFDDQIPF